MEIERCTGRLVGLFLLAQITGLIVLYILLRPLSTGHYWDTAAPAAGQIRMAALLLLVNCGVAIAISTVIFRMSRRLKFKLAIGLLASAILMLVLQAIDSAFIFAMLAKSRQYMSLASPDAAFQSAAAALGSFRRIAHYAELFSIDLWICLFYLCIYRLGIVPKWVSIFGLTTVGLHLFGLVVPTIIFGSGVVALGASMALSHVTSAVWLLARGFPHLGRINVGSEPAALSNSLS